MSVLDYQIRAKIADNLLKVSRACTDEQVRNRLLLLAKDYLGDKGGGKRVAESIAVKARHCLTD